MPRQRVGNFFHDNEVCKKVCMFPWDFQSGIIFQVIALVWHMGHMGFPPAVMNLISHVSHFLGFSYNFKIQFEYFLPVLLFITVKYKFVVYAPRKACNANTCSVILGYRSH